jgi:hypothetical protein
MPVDEFPRHRNAAVFFRARGRLNCARVVNLCKRRKPQQTLTSTSAEKKEKRLTTR